MPRRDDLETILHHRQRADRDRPGLRVRLLGHAGLPRAARRGLPGGAGQLEPGHDHDRPRLRRPHLRRAAHRRGARPRSSSASGPTPCCPPSAARPALNLAMELVRARRHRPVPGTPELIGANAEAIATAEDRERFKQAMVEIGLAVPASRHRPHAATRPMAVAERDRPAGDRPAGLHPRRPGHRASPRRPRSSARLAAAGLDASPISEILIERSIAGWKEFELEVMRDRADNCVVICSIENFDPMGVHTGDSITVAPAQTLSDVEYQQMRDAAFACIRRVGVETGGSNVQFAVDPGDRRAGHHRDEPAGEPVERAGVEGHRLPDRQDRRPPGRRLHARRDPERHHPQDAGQLRADHRLRRHQGPALGLREAARHDRRARHADAERRRGDGHRPHLPRELPEGAALARDRAASG